MNTFKLFFKLVKANWVSHLFLPAVIYLAMTLPFAFMSQETNFQARSVQIGIVNKDGDDPISQDVIHRLSTHHHLRSVEEGEKAQVEAFYMGKAQVMLMIPSGFGKALKDGRVQDAPLEITSKDYPQEERLVKEELATYLNTWQLLALAQTRVSGQELELDQQFKDLDQALEDHVEILYENSGDSEMQLGVGERALPILSYVFVISFIYVMGTTFYVMRQSEIQKRERLGHVKPWKRVLETYLAGACLGVGYWIFFMVTLNSLFGGVLGKTVIMWGIVGASFINMLSILAFSYFVAMLANSPGAVNFSSTLLGLLIAFGSGIFVPLEVVSPFLRSLVSLVSPIWNIRLTKLLFNLETWTIGQRQEALSYVGIQVLLGVTYLTLSLLIMKYRLKAQKE